MTTPFNRLHEALTENGRAVPADAAVTVRAGDLRLLLTGSPHPQQGPSKPLLTPLQAAD